MGFYVRIVTVEYSSLALLTVLPPSCVCVRACVHFSFALINQMNFVSLFWGAPVFLKMRGIEIGSFLLFEKYV